MRSIKTAAAAFMVVVLGASPALACRKNDHAEPHHKQPRVSWDTLLLRGINAPDAPARRSAAVTAGPGTKDLSAYQGLGSWIDIFNTKPWANPARVVRTMHARGAKAIFLQTSTYGQGTGIYDQKAVDAYLHHAHRRDMKVVAWYVPAFDQQKIDFKRVRAAIRYRSPTGERFDSFGLDIEATNVGDVSLRNERLLSLSKRIRNLAGPNYPLGAITPDPVEATYWPSFPYKELAKTYDVFVPMGYFTFRAAGFKEVHDYTKQGIRTIRRETGDPDVPIHFIGGIADDAEPRELKGFVKAARDHKIEGASLYDYPITSRESWFEMGALSTEVAARRRAAAADKAEAAKERRGLAKQREAAKRRKAENEKGASKKSDANGGKRSAGSANDASKKRNVRGRRSPSSSASHRDRESLREGERERRRPRARDRRPRRS